LHTTIKKKFGTGILLTNVPYVCSATYDTVILYNLLELLSDVGISKKKIVTTNISARHCFLPT